MNIRQFLTAALLLTLTQTQINAQTLKTQELKSESSDSSDSSDSKIVQIPKPAAGVAKEYVFIGKSLSSSCQTGSDTLLKGTTMLVVAGYESCTSPYSNPKGFYTVFKGAQKYYIRESDLELSGQEAHSIKSLSPEQQSLFFKQAEGVAIYLRKKEISEVLNVLDSHKKSGLTVVSSGIADVSEHTEGTSFSIEVINQASKPIKYVWFTVVGYNAVGDPVRGRLGTSITVKGIGPIAPEDSGSYEWEYLWHSDVVETFKLPKIKVQYMDGSVREVKNVKAITLSRAHRTLLKDAGDN
ncbi:MAG: hypothetical protein RR775_00470 [Massilia sp.]|uniref:hypothetical protein n=1 Tax=Massilia sp. TaxID=1882437 RepID=UPI002FCA55D6